MTNAQNATESTQTKKLYDDLGNGEKIAQRAFNSVLAVFLIWNNAPTATRTSNTAGMFAQIAETTKTRKQTANAKTKRRNGTKGRVMTLQKAIELVVIHQAWRTDVDERTLVELEHHYGLTPRSLTEAIDVLLATAKDVLRCEDDGK